jgi:glycyl-tRNA synthetase beta subunit
MRELQRDVHRYGKWVSEYHKRWNEKRFVTSSRLYAEALGECSEIIERAEERKARLCLNSLEVKKTDPKIAEIPANALEEVVQMLLDRIQK